MTENWLRHAQKSDSFRLRRNLVALSFLLLILDSQAAFCESSCKAIFEKVFAESYYDPDIYEPSQCHVNVQRLLKKLKENHADISQARVLYIFRRWPLLQPLHPQFGRDGWSHWDFHVVLENNKVIYDLDFAQHPLPYPRIQYFLSVFPKKKSFYRRALRLKEIDPLDSIYVRTVPATYYLKHFDLFGTVDTNIYFYLNNTETRFKKIKATDYIAR